MSVRDDSATSRVEVATEVCRPSCSRAANSGSADACPFATSHYAKPELGWKLLRLWQQWTTCRVKRDRVTFLVVRILQYRPVPDVCTGISATRNTTSEHIITSKHTRPNGFGILPKNFECFVCEASNYFREAPQSSQCEVQIPLKRTLQGL